MSDEKKPITWRSYEYLGAEILDAEGKTISNDRDLFAGQEVLVPTLFGGYSRSVINADSAGGSSATARDGGSIWFIHKAVDDKLPEDLRRHVWVSSGGGNLKALQKLEFSIQKNVPVSLCHVCGGEATCYGKYDDSPWDFACDSCCGHGNEDGICHRLGTPEAHEAITRQV